MNPHDLLGSADFKSAVSADFTIRACAALLMLSQAVWRSSLSRFSGGAAFFGAEGSRRSDALLGRLSNHLHKERVDAAVVREFRMKRGGEKAALPDEHGIPVARGEDLDLRSETADARSADEHHLQRTARKGSVGVEDH